MSKQAESKELTNWEERMAAKAADVAAVERPATSTISFKSGVMTYMGEAVPNNELEIIVIMGITEHVLYTSAYDPDNVSPPDCFAIGHTGTPLAPHATVPNPQAEACAGCPQFEWGSGRGRGKACAEKRRLAVIPGTTKADDVAGAEVAVVKLPVTSVKNYSTYVNTLATQYNRPPWGVVTKMKLVPDAKTQFKIVFEPTSIIDDPSLLAALDQRESTVEDILMTPYDMTPTAEEAAPNGKY